MKNITLITMENSANHGLGVNLVGYQLSVSDYDSKEAVLQRIRDAAKEYCNTKNGRDTFTRNCNCFNYGDFFTFVPEKILHRHGIYLAATIEIIDVCFDEQLVLESDINNTIKESR